MIERTYTDYGATSYPIGGTDIPSVSSIVTRWHSYGLERMKLRMAVEGGRRYPQLEADRVIGIVMKDGGEAARHGKEVHSVLEKFNFHKKRGDTPWEEALIQHWERIMRTYQLQVIETERMVCVPGKWAGRTDMWVVSPRWGVIILDVKTGKMTLEHVVQIAAYANATHIVDDETGAIEPIQMAINPLRALIANFDKENGECHVYEVDLTGAYAVFQHLLALHDWEVGKRSKSGAPWSELSPDGQDFKSITAEDLVESFNASMVDAIQHYRVDSWNWLRAVVKTYRDVTRQALAASWPGSIPTFKKVAESGEYPTLEEIEQVELAMIAAESATMHPFEDPLTRPLPPPMATIAECPPVHYRVDVPHPQIVARVHALWATLTPKQKKAYKGDLKSRKPAVPTRAEAEAITQQLLELSTTNQ